MQMLGESQVIQQDICRGHAGADDSEQESADMQYLQFVPPVGIDPWRYGLADFRNALQETICLNPQKECASNEDKSHEETVGFSQAYFLSAPVSQYSGQYYKRPEKGR